MLKTAVLASFLLVVQVQSAFAQTVPVLSQRHVEIVKILFGQHEALAKGSDDDRRALTTLMIGQLVCEFPGEGWTGKSASRTRPFSKDSLARQIGDKLYSWDWQNGSSRMPQVSVGQPPSFDITGQNPIAVASRCSLQPPVVPGGPVVVPPTQDPSALTIDELYAEFNEFRMEARMAWSTQQQTLARVEASLEAHREVSRGVMSKIKGILTSGKTWTAVAGVVAGYLGKLYTERKK